MRLSEIMEAAGISKAFASQVRAGIYMPHISTWESLRALIKANTSTDFKHLGARANPRKLRRRSRSAALNPR